MAWTLDPTPTPDASWNYADQSDVEDLLEESSLAIIDGDTDDTTVDSGRVLRAGERSDADMDSRLAALGFVTPLTGTDDTTDLLMTEANVKLVAWRLNQSRAIITIGSAQQLNPNAIDAIMNQWRNDALSLFAGIGDGSIKVTADRLDDAPPLPNITDQPGTFQNVTLVRNGRFGRWCGDENDSSWCE